MGERIGQRRNILNRVGRGMLGVIRKIPLAGTVDEEGKFTPVPLTRTALGEATVTETRSCRSLAFQVSIGLALICGALAAISEIISRH